ncbi:hypothetical protein B0A50_02329 [Salinomyces thailandicus]|uniref:Uncharacterized protein n=1 Tax=Salinomyces thailandicus TaxID=706561 RepID=A0A4U0U9X7_9PEZI|nr:hypothetical protein B0A50_02329 [Salinomyces thailandica]
MQHVPSGMLQELQQQRESKARPESGESRPYDEGGDRRHGRGAGAPQASLPLGTTHLARADLTTPPETQLNLSPAIKSLRQPSTEQETSRRRVRAQSDSEQPGPSGTEPQRRRPRPGSEASASPPRPRTTEAVPPQLLGGRAGPNARPLMREEPPLDFRETPDSPESAKSTYFYHAAQKETTAEQMRSLLLPHKTSRKGAEMLARRASEPPTPPKTPSPSSSSSYNSKQSQVSRASSFAHFLRHNEPDLRLLKKKSQPEQHTRKHALIVRTEHAPVRRTPSYYAPKVVEDTAASPPALSPPVHSISSPLSLTAAQFAQEVDPPTASNAKVPTAPISSTGRTPKKVGARTSTEEFPPSPGFVPPPPSVTALARPGLRTSMHISNLPKAISPKLTLSKSPAPPDRSVSADTSSPSRTDHQERERGRPALRTSQQRSSERPDHPAFKEARHYHDVTPPNVEPTSPSAALSRHADHYFRTFAPGTTIPKVFTPTLIPPEPDYFRSFGAGAMSRNETPLTLRPTTPGVSLPISPLAASPSSPLQAAMPPTRPPLSTPARSTATKRKRSSVFNAFNKQALINSSYEASSMGKPPTKRPTPDTLKSGASSEKATTDASTSSSEISVPQYFARPRLHGTLSEGASSRISPMDVGEAKVSRPALGHTKSSSEQLSPLTQPRPKPRLRHRATLEDIDDSEANAHSARTVVTSQSASRPVASMRKAYATGEDTEYEKSRITGHAALSWLPSEMRRVPTPPPDAIPAPPESESSSSSKKRARVNARGKRWSLIRQLIRDLRQTTEPNSPEPPAMKRRHGIAHKISVSALRHTSSISQFNKLKRMASETTMSTMRAKPPSPELGRDLKVTNFEQTPFAQRYGNTKRAERNQIRHWIEKTIDDEEDDETQLGFELDVPDHLPNSPLCPLSPRHKSGGKAICPMHGRNKAPPSPVRRAPTKQEPRIVAEGREDGHVEGGEGGRGGNGEFEDECSRLQRVSYRSESGHAGEGDRSWFS